MTDEELMILVRKGDLSKLKHLFERYHEKIYRFFFRLTLQQDVSEELTQQVFYRLIHYRESYRDLHNHFRSWIYQIARNLYYDHQKEQIRIKNLVTEIGDTAEAVIDGVVAFTESDYMRLDQALLLLDEPAREMIVMRCYHRLAYDEIASITGKSESAIRVQFHRAIKTLRKIYFKQK